MTVKAKGYFPVYDQIKHTFNNVKFTVVYVRHYESPKKCNFNLLLHVKDKTQPSEDVGQMVSIINSTCTGDTRHEPM